MTPARPLPPLCRFLAAAWRQVLGLVVALGLAVTAGSAGAAPLDLRDLEVRRNEEGLFLAFSARFVLPRAVEDALMKGVPLHFLAEAKTYRPRWYWRDERVAKSTRTWRLSYQPLTRQYRVTFGSLNQNFESLVDALVAMQRVVRWKIADATQLEAGERYYVELSYRLDISQLPRPFQLGIGGQADWNLSAESVLVLQDPS